MKAKLQKAYQRSGMILRDFFGKWRDYSFIYAIHSTLWWVGFYTHNKKLHRWAELKIRDYIFKYFEANYNDIILKYTNNTNCNTKIEEYPIWVFWAQGFENAPELVRMCNANLLKTNKNVKLLTLDNISDYVDIPQYVYDRVNNKTMTLILFSDILRVNLLSKWGGVWVDSTCFICRDLAQWGYGKIFTSPSALTSSPYKLCCWSIGTNEINSPLFAFVRDMLHALAAENKYQITHLIIDNTIQYAYEHFESVNEMIDSCPQNNLKRNDLHFLLNSTYDQDKYDQLIDNDWIFKLSYKTPWRKTDSEGNLTFYGKLLEDNGL